MFPSLGSLAPIAAMLPSSDVIAALEAQLRGLQFPFLGDADGEATWEEAIRMVMALFGDGYVLRRRNNSRVSLRTNDAVLWRMTRIVR